MGVAVIRAWIEHVRRGSREERAAGLLRRGVLRDSDRLATCCIQALSLVRGERLWIGGPSPPRHQLLYGIHDRILDRADQIDELVAPAAMASGEVDELAHARIQLALRRRRDDRDAPAAPDLEQSLVPKLPKRAEDGVSVHLQHAGEVQRGREPLTRAGLSVRDRTADLGRNLLVQVCRLVAVQIDMKHLY